MTGSPMHRPSYDGPQPTDDAPQTPDYGAQPCSGPPAGALAWAAELLGHGAPFGEPADSGKPRAPDGSGEPEGPPAPAIRTVRALDGGSHASTHLLETASPVRRAVLRRFPPGDDAAAREASVLAALDGLDGFAPRLLGADPRGERCGAPAVLISRLDGEADISPADPDAAAAALGRALARLHAVPGSRLHGFRDGMAATRRGTGPAAAALGEREAARLAGQPRVLTHFDYWSGNVLWHGGALTGVVDWSGASLAPRGFDVGWCRLDLALLHGPDTTAAGAFSAAYRDAYGAQPPDAALWDLHALARSHRTVETWVPNYAGLGRSDLTARELRRRHTAWTERCLDAAVRQR